MSLEVQACYRNFYNGFLVVSNYRFDSPGRAFMKRNINPARRKIERKANKHRCIGCYDHDFSNAVPWRTHPSEGKT